MQQDATPCNIQENDLSEKQVVAVEMLAAGRSISEIVKTLSIERTTLWRWRQEVAFKHAVRERVVAQWSDVGVRLGGMIDPALDVMCEQLEDHYRPTRFRAAQTILRLSGLSKAVGRAVDV